ATPSEVKSAVTGDGRADKTQVGRMVALLLGLDEPPTSDDAADALAIAIWQADTWRADAAPAAGAPVLDRAAVAPITRGQTGYERAVHEAIARERASRRPVT
ncbi:MAG: crossover junction endodeoxyribonuclease RuvC, partial [Chloroflexota bacterium]